MAAQHVFVMGVLALIIAGGFYEAFSDNPSRGWRIFAGTVAGLFSLIFVFLLVYLLRGGV